MQDQLSQKVAAMPNTQATEKTIGMTFMGILAERGSVPQAELIAAVVAQTAANESNVIRAYWMLCDSGYLREDAGDNVTAADQNLRVP